MKLSQILLVLCVFLIGFYLSEAKSNCGLKCFRWKKCMGQLSGNENRPGQLGNTGQIVLKTCDAGDCDCEEEERKKEEKKKIKEEEKATPKPSSPKKSSRFPSKIRSPFRTRTSSSFAGNNKRLVNRRPETSVRVSSSVSSSSRDSEEEEKEESLGDEEISGLFKSGFLLNSRTLAKNRRRVLRQRYF